MTDALYGLDPELTTFGRITKRTTPDPDVRFGLGSPRQFPFNNGPTLDPVWWAEAPPPGWSVNQINGVLQINAANSNSASDQTQGAANRDQCRVRSRQHGLHRVSHSRHTGQKCKRS